uniref:site-specific DNA-methyltransferase (adenine-specific) n=1 Tax=Dictyoglomus thermophilum TaxID=14 RepID=A0A7C3RKB2_DICTH
MANNGELKEKLKSKLREVFQFENEDLDFGIYRIMNYKRKEIEKFIEQELIEEVRKQLELVGEEEITKIKGEFEKIKQKIKENLGDSAFENGELKEEFKTTPLGKEYYEKKKQLEEIKISEDLEREIYNHLINFFSRYYDKGDFISKRRYGKNEKYVVPYNGEEILLYWANKDQYYIKTTEYFRKYSFYKDTLSGRLTVNFKVVEAEEEKGNIKSPDKKFFVLDENIFDFNKEINELNIYFEYRGLTEEEEEKYKQKQSVSQDQINEEIVKILEEKIPKNSLARLIFEKEGEKKLIEKHLYRYTRRNTTDYFIHKDLKSFLERELDFYIKNEFLDLEDLKVLEESGYFDKLRLYLVGGRVFRNIALKIIEFLSQIENFQKKIWEKKKFIIDTHYVITLDKIKEYAGEEFLESILDEILKNEKQLVEWKELFGIDVTSKEDLLENNTLIGKDWKKYPIDTRYFDGEFKWRLLVALSKNNDLEKILDGVLIKSENFQALNLLLNKYYEKVQTIYIDPPFNKEQEADYLYKVGYKDATWATLLESRLRLAKDLLNEKGSIFVRCDYNGNWIVRCLMNEIFGKENFRNEISLRKVNYQGTNVPERFNPAYDLLYFYRKSDKVVFNMIFKERDRESKWVNAISPKENKNANVIEIEGRKFWAPKNHHWRFSQAKFNELNKAKRIRIYEEYEYIDVLGRNQKGLPQYLESEQTPVDSNWTDINSYSFGWGFSTENSEILLKRVIESTSNEGDLVMDFFLGSGTTTAVAHKLRRKWIGVEMGEHFWTVVLPRMKKVLFYDKSGISKEKDVKEIYNEKQSGGFFKYYILEQYEDALENIEFEEQTENQKNILNELPDYFVKYMLEWETKNSKTFLNIDEMKDPFNYKLKIIENYQQKIVNVDLVETFNYLLGLNISRYEVLQENGRKYVFVFGEKDGKRVAIVWRSILNIDFEKDKEIIENKLKEINPDEIYINGEALIKVFRHIEPLFKSLMFGKVE